jgi:hypothetical protein
MNTVSTHLDLFMRVVQMKPVRGMFWAKGNRLLKMVPVGVDAGIPLTHQLMEILRKEFPGLLLKHCTTTASTSLSGPNLRPFNALLRWPNTWKSHGDRSGNSGDGFNTWSAACPGRYGPHRDRRSATR